MKPHTRRAFLQGALQASATLPFLAGPWVRAARALSLDGKKRHLHARAYFSMHTLVEVVAVGARPEKLPTACEAAFAACQEIDRAMNFYDPESELSALNRSAAKGWTEVSPALFKILEISKQVYEASEGAFDPTVGRSVLLYRKARRDGKWPNGDASDEAAQGIGFSLLDLEPASKRVRFGKAAALLDLSGIAKGYAVDLATRAMRETGASGGIVNAGGDLFVFGPSVEGLPPVVIEDPYEPGRMRETLQILEEGLATSGDSEEGVTVQGRPCSHLIDPSRGMPVRASVGSASVRAESAALADAWASALYVRPELASKAGAEGFFLTGAEHQRASAGFFQVAHGRS